MPASMMKAEAGSSPKVKGSSSATVGIGPMPGSTPMAVPISTPNRQYSRFCHCSAVVRPRSRLSNRSMGSLTYGLESRPDRHRQVQQQHEQDHRGGAEPD